MYQDGVLRCDFCHWPIQSGQVTATDDIGQCFHLEEKDGGCEKKHIDILLAQERAIVVGEIASMPIPTEDIEEFADAY
jgi:hypothetical protein